MSLLARVIRRELSRPLCLERRLLLLNNASRCSSSGRRLRRLKPTPSRYNTEFKMPDTGGLSEAFEPDEDMNEYLKKVSLSPWVPTPDPVGRRVLDLLNASKDDTHVDLGSGDGRMNFHASDPPYSVKKSIGIDIDTKVVELANERLSKRHPKPNIEFIIGDLKDANAEVWKQVGEATIITMYFVKEALAIIQPTLEKVLLGKKCRIATVGYPMPKSSVEWDPIMAEVILGTPIHIYELGFPMTDRLTPPDVDEPVAGDASNMKLAQGRQPFKDEYGDVERVDTPLVDPDDFQTIEDEDWDTIPGEPKEDDDDKNPVWRKP